MRGLLIGMRAVDKAIDKQEICKDFRAEFNVDLGSERYANGQLQDKWELLIQDCTISKRREKWEEHIRLIEEKLFDLLDKDRSGLQLKDSPVFVCRDAESQRAIEQKNREEFKEFLNECVALLDNYWIYEADVWLNAWLVLKYLECQKQKGILNEKTQKGYGNTEGGNVLDDNAEEHKLPFEDDEGGYFCTDYLKAAIGNKGCLFWTELGEGESINILEDNEKKDVEKRILNKADIKLKQGKTYDSFTYQRIQKLEQDMGIEDKFLIHKTINGVLLRNMINKMYDNNKFFEVENYVDLVDKLCGCRSLVWQNLIGCMYALFDKYKVELNVLGFYEDADLVLCVWLDHIKKINYDLRILTEGFLYLYERNEHEDAYFEKRCRDFLTNMELETSDLVREYWDKQKQKKKDKDELRVSSPISKHRSEYCWIYAILQRRAIDTIKNLYRNNQFVEEAQSGEMEFTDGHETFKIPVLNKIVSASQFQIDLKNAVRQVTKQKK